jgi:spermidine synthase
MRTSGGMAVKVRFDRPGLGIKVMVFFAGAAVMALELLGSRLLFPVFGSDIFVWGSLIGIVLAGLSAGYYLGGKLADIKPDFNTFSLVIFCAGILALLMPLVSPPIFDLVVSLNVGNRYGPLLATTIILAPPSVLLGMVSPFAIRLLARTFADLGKVSGNLYSLSTIGSIIGVFLTVFVLIPEFGVNRIIYGVGLALVIVSMIGLNIKIKAIVILLLLLSPFVAPYLTRRATVAAYTLAFSQIVYETDTPYHHILVADGPDPIHGGARVRTLVLDDNFHSSLDLDEPLRNVYVYTEYFHVGLLFNPNVTRVLFIGGGGFTGPKQFLAYYPNVQVDVVEIDPEVVRVAKEYFGVTDNPRLRIFISDGRVYLRQSETLYDLIVLDAYSKTYVPFHLMTREFFDEMKLDMSGNGVVVSNLITYSVGAASELLKAEVRTMATVFPNVYVFPTRGADFAQAQNIMLVASAHESTLSREALLQLADRTPLPVNAKDLLSTYMALNLSRSPILTDDFAPVETLLNPITGQPLGRAGDEVVQAAYLESLRLILAAVVALGVVITFGVLRRRRSLRAE